MTKKDVLILILLLIGIGANLMFQDSLAADGDGDWELRQLHEPSPLLQARERAGRVTIYDGVTVTEIDRAMDNQFDRIGSMMFIRIKRPADDGSYYEDSDCD